MNAERWKKIDALIDAALELPVREREAFLAAQCSGDEELRREVSSLLEAQTEADNFLENSAMGLMARELAAQNSAEKGISFVGKEIGTYTIEKLLGAGGMGEVYLAHDRKLNRKVALKILPVEFVSEPERIRRFGLEARAVSALNHPNIVTVYDVGESDGWHFIATEFIIGKTVRELVGKLRLKEILSIISQAADALGTAHKAGIIHRDIKPENIMVRDDGYVKVLDFGLAKLIETDEHTPEFFAKTQKGVVLGTLAYMSPEQISDDNVDHRTDLWSLGVVLYEMLTGTNPFKSDSRQSTFNAILNVEPPPVTDYDANLPAELNQILIKALEKAADLSYQTASDFRADLKRLLRLIDSDAVSKTSGSYVLGKKKVNNSWWIPAFLSTILIAALGGGAFIWLQNLNAQTNDESSPWNNAVAAQLTDFAGIESHPNLSPDGKILIYTRQINGKSDIFWQRIGGSNAQNLTADTPEDDSQPAFSPDGELIAFRSERGGGGIFVMGATGESVKRLSDFGYSPAWSPDGKEIVFTSVEFDEPASRSNDSEIWTVNAATGAKHRIEISSDAMQPQFSPDGSRIVFWGRDEKYQRDLWTVAATGGAAVRVTNDAELDWNPVWSGDGKFIYFCSNRNGGTSIWRIRVDEQSGKPLDAPEAVAPFSQSWLITLSRDGKNLVYARRQRLDTLQKVEFDAKKMQVIGKPAALTEGSKRARTPDFSPDGKSVVFYYLGDTQDDIAIINLENQKQNLLTNDAPRDRVPRFSPDGSRIAFYSNISGIYEIWTMKPDGTDRRQLTNYGNRGLTYPLWSPDGLRIAVTPFEGELQVIESNKTWAEQTPFKTAPFSENKNERFIGWSWSPDGKKIAGWKSEATDTDAPGIYVYRLETNDYEKISEIGARPVWLADSRNLLITDNNKLFVLDSQTKTEREILSNAPQAILAPAVSRDNRQIVYCLQTIESDIQMLSLK